MTSNKVVKDVGGTDEFRTYYQSLSDTDPLKLELKNAFVILKGNCLSGQKIERNKWPAVYVKKYKINNLWRYTLQSGWRLIYTIIGESDGLVVSVLEVFSHKDYDERFGY
mgnify:CR=1 FL=1